MSTATVAITVNIVNVIKQSLKKKQSFITEQSHYGMGGSRVLNTLPHPINLFLGGRREITSSLSFSFSSPPVPLVLPPLQLSLKSTSRLPNKCSRNCCFIPTLFHLIDLVLTLVAAFYINQFLFLNSVSVFYRILHSKSFELN